MAGLLGAGLILAGPSTAVGQSLGCNHASTGPGGIEAGEPEKHGYVGCSGGPAGAPYSFSVTPPSHGVVSDTALRQDGDNAYVNYTYTGAASYRGPDSFTVNVTRGGETVSVNVSFNVVAPVNEAPSCSDRVFDGNYYAGQSSRAKLPAGVAVAGSLNCNDEEHAPRSYAVLQAPVFGSLPGVRTEPSPSGYAFDTVSGKFTLQLDEGYSGPDDFTLRVFDGANCSNVKVSYLVLPAKKSPNEPFVTTTGCGPVAPRPPVLNGRSAAAAVRVSRKGSFVLPKHLIACAGAGPACRVKISVTATARANFARTLRIGKSSFKLAADKRRKVRGKLSRKGRAWLKLAKSWRAKVKITVRRGAAKPVKKTIRVTLKAPK